MALVYDDSCKLTHHAIMEISILMELTVSCSIDEYYTSSEINTEETILNYGVIITTENGNYYVTTFIPNYIKITSYKFNGNKYKIDKIHANYYHNLTAILLETQCVDIKSFDINLDIQFIIKNDIYVMMSGVIEDAVTLPKSMVNYTYNFNVTKNKCNIVDKMKLIINLNGSSIDIDLTSIYPGNAICDESNLKLLGIIESVEYVNEEYVINVVPMYVIGNWLKTDMSSSTYNMYVELDDNNSITNIYDSISDLHIEDVILSINEIPVNTFGMMTDNKLMLDISMMMYIYYNYGARDVLQLLCLRNDEIINITCKLSSLDNVMQMPYNNVQYCCEINNYKIKTLSIEMLNYLMEKNIYLKNKQINGFYDAPFNTIHDISFAYITNDISLQHVHSQINQIKYNFTDLIKKNNDDPKMIMLPMIAKVNGKNIKTSHEIALIARSRSAQTKILEKLKGCGIDMESDVEERDITLEIMYNNDKFLKRIEI